MLINHGTVRNSLNAVRCECGPEAARVYRRAVDGKLVSEAPFLGKLGDLRQVAAAFMQADQQKILPWHAEIAFRERRFTEVRRCLLALSRPGEKGRELAQVRAWWTA